MNLVISEGGMNLTVAVKLKWIFEIELCFWKSNCVINPNLYGVF